MWVLAVLAVVTSAFTYLLVARARALSARLGSGGGGDDDDEEEEDEEDEEVDAEAHHARVQRTAARLVAFGHLNDDTRRRLRLAFLNRNFTGDDFEMLAQLDEHTATHRGATQAQINHLPTHTVTQQFVDAAAAADAVAGAASPGASGPSSRSACAICLAPYEVGDVVRTVLCMHVYHRQCIDSWLQTKNECPCCKSVAIGEGRGGEEGGY